MTDINDNEFEELPERDERQEIRAIVLEHEMRLIGRLLLRERPLARASLS